MVPKRLFSDSVTEFEINPVVEEEICRRVEGYFEENADRFYRDCEEFSTLSLRFFDGRQRKLWYLLINSVVAVSCGPGGFFHKPVRQVCKLNLAELVCSEGQDGFSVFSIFEPPKDMNMNISGLYNIAGEYEAQ